MSLAAVLTQHGANVSVLSAPPSAVARASTERVDAFRVESPPPSDVVAFARLGPPVIMLAEHVGPEEIEAGESLGAHAVLDKSGSLAELSIAIGTARRELSHTP